eukprot:SAG31_NODE_227_length_19818_cov_6.503271_1_plen_20_part_10
MISASGMCQKQVRGYFLGFV